MTVATPSVRFRVTLALTFLGLLVGCAGHDAMPTSATTFDGTYPVTLTFVTAPSPSVERCGPRVARTLTVENGAARMTWTTVPKIDLSGAVNTSGIARATTSDHGDRASLTAKLDPTHHTATGVFDNNGCIYDVRPAT